MRLMLPVHLTARQRLLHHSVSSDSFRFIASCVTQFPLSASGVCRNSASKVSCAAQFIGNHLEGWLDTGAWCHIGEYQ